MDFLGRISAGPDGPPIDRQRWVELIGEHPDLARPRPREIINPFTKKPAVIKPRSDIAHVILDGKQVGSMSWAEDDSDSIGVFGGSDVLPPAQAVAESLGARFEEGPEESA